MDLTLLRIISLKTGLGLNYISKEDKISSLTLQLSKLFNENLIMKGGTAINRVFLSKIGSARFSEDIDLDFISTEPINKKIGFIKKQMALITDFNIGKPRLLHRIQKHQGLTGNHLSWI